MSVYPKPDKKLLDAITCPACQNRFDATSRKPMFLPCGHTMCLRCCQELEINSNSVDVLTCPFDRRAYRTNVESLCENKCVLNLATSFTRDEKRKRQERAREASNDDYATYNPILRGRYLNR